MTKPVLHTILVFLFACSALCLQAQLVSDSIFMNQLGFYPHAVKKAFILTSKPEKSFWLVGEENGSIVFTGKLGPVRSPRLSGIESQEADFTAWQRPGVYRLRVGSKVSATFRIGNHVLDTVAKAALKGYYYQRSNIPLEEKYAGPWHRPAGHPDTNVLVHPSAASASRPAGTRISTPGGWYDAGDYNKYIVNSGITVGTLLAAYEDFPRYFDTSTVLIPEEGSGLPALLEETRYNLLWMLTMQDADGGVYHKCTNAAFDGMVMPGVTKAPRYAVQKSTAATLDFAAVMAMAARVYKGFPATAAWSRDCLNASEAAWNWAQLHPDSLYNQEAMNRRYQPAITTGEYGDDSVRDEFFWAAAELLTTTHKPMYEKAVEIWAKQPVQLPSWDQVELMGYASLVRHQEEQSSWFQMLIQSYKDSIRLLADRLVRPLSNSAFGTVMGQRSDDFVWGSNAVAANQGMLLIWAFRIAGRSDYLRGALGNLDYILGRNSTGYCFVTGFGHRSPQHPHHRTSVADGIEAPVPGLMVGGPNPGQQDHCKYPSKEADLSYSDSSCAYASNEIAINWNAPLVYLASAIEAIMSAQEQKAQH